MLTPRQALAVLPDNAALLNAAGLATAETAWFHRAIAVAPDQPEPYANLAAALGSRDHARAAVSLAPDNAEAWNNLGTIRSEEADFHRARQIRPDFADACINESGLRNDRGEAGTLARLAVALSPGLPAAWNNLANGLLLACRLDESDKAFRRARALAPQDAQIRFNHAAVLLKQGRMEEGWEAYEARRHTPAALIRRRSLEPSNWPPDWPGGDPAGKTLLLSTEQGYGDAIQFSRFASWMAGQGARVILRTNAPLVRLLRTLPGVEQVLSFEDELPPFDFHLPVMSLPRFYGEMAAPAPYLFADPGPWRDRLADLPGRKVGLCWSGNPRPGQRAANLLDARRSLKSSDFAAFAGIGDVTLVSLQKDAKPDGLALIDWTDELEDFADTAALVQALDLVISVDTSVAHLAGALGKSVCILSRFDGCWRWLQDMDLTPWYSSAYLFRQTRPGHWREPLEALYKHIVTE
jgi:Tfp pilus assembly protein PilF